MKFGMHGIAIGILLFLCVPAGAAIVIVPTPTSTIDDVHIQVVNLYVSAASITSASIARSGNQFTIDQTVSVGCFLPSAPILTSDFDVGRLPAGTYTVTANIQNVGVLGCASSSVTQSGSFAVAAPEAVPSATPLGYLIMGSLIALLGARRLPDRSGRRRMGGGAAAFQLRRPGPYSAPWRRFLDRPGAARPRREP